MHFQRDILVEKYKLVHENDAKLGLGALAKEFKLINFFNYIVDVPEEYSKNLDSIILYWAEILTFDIAADMGIPDDNIPDWEAEAHQYYDYMSRAIKLLFKKYPEELAKHAPGVTEQEALDALGEVIDRNF